MPIPEPEHNQDNEAGSDPNPGGISPDAGTDSGRPATGSGADSSPFEKPLMDYGEKGQKSPGEER